MQGLPYLLNLNPQEHSFILIATNVLHWGHNFNPFGPGFTSTSPESRIRRYRTIIIPVINTELYKLLLDHLHLDGQQMCTFTLNIPTTTLYCCRSIIEMTTPVSLRAMVKEQANKITTINYKHMYTVFY